MSHALARVFCLPARAVVWLRRGYECVRSERSCDVVLSIQSGVDCDEGVHPNRGNELTPGSGLGAYVGKGNQAASSVSA